MTIKAVFRAGFPRTGSHSMAQLYTKLGIKSQQVKQDRFMRPIKNELSINYFDLDKPPASVIEYAQYKRETVPKKEHYFEADPYSGMAILYLEKYVPNVEIIVIIRDPVKTCNSFRNYRLINRSLRRPTDVNFYVDKWIIYYKQVLMQMAVMKKRPIIMMFEDYISGNLNRTLAQLFDTTSDRDLRIIETHLTKKVDHKGKYEIKKVQKDLREEAQGVYRLFYDMRVSG